MLIVNFRLVFTEKAIPVRVKTKRIYLRNALGGTTYFASYIKHISQICITQIWLGCRSFWA